MPKQSRWLAWLLLAFLSLVWGASYLLIKKSLIAFSWDQVATLRISISMLALLPFAIQAFRKVDWKKDGFNLFLMVLTGNCLPAFLFPIAQTEISSSMTGIISSLTPLFTLTIAVLFFKTIITRQRLIGVLIGFFGASLLIAFGENLTTNGNNWYSLFAVLATILYAINGNIIKKYAQHLSSLTTASIGFLMIGPFAIFYLLQTDFLTTMQNHDFAWQSLGSVAVLAVFGTALATVLFIRLIQMTSAVFGSMISYFVPIVAIALGLLDGEIITLWHILGITLILGGVYLAKGK